MKTSFVPYQDDQLVEGIIIRDRLVKSSKYIPKKIESKIIRMNNEKAPVKEILKVLESKSNKRKK